MTYDLLLTATATIFPLITCSIDRGQLSQYLYEISIVFKHLPYLRVLEYIKQQDTLIPMYCQKVARFPILSFIYLFFFILIFI